MIPTEARNAVVDVRQEKPILLLGGCGYVGSAVIRDLSAHGLRVDSVDLEWFGNPWRGTRLSNVRRDYASLTAEELEEYGTIVLLAGHTSVLECSADPASAFRNNVVSFVELLGKLNPEQRFIYASSARVYAEANSCEADESWDRLRPTTYYDLAKVEIDEYARLSGLDVYGLRFGTVCGAAPHVRTDVMLNRMFLTHRERGAIPLANPDVHRPILGMRDLVRAVRSVVTAAKAQPGLYNLASFNARLWEIAERAAAHLGSEVVLASPSPTSDMRISTAKFEKAFSFRFEETVESILTSLEDGIDTALQSTRDRPNSVTRSAR